jgi:xylan 1,4-beta-xylosidase
LADLSGEKQDRANVYIELPRPVRTRYIRYEHGYVASPNLAIGDIRIFGNGDGHPPATPAGLAVHRDADPRNALVSWKSVPGAVGYNVLWGIQPGKLYQTYQVFADRPGSLEIRALTRGQDNRFAIEAFDENGVSKVSRPVHVR